MFIIWLAVAGIIILMDQLVKHWVTTNIVLGGTKAFIPHILDFLYVRNNGAAWSILQGKTWFFYITTGVTTILIIYLLFRWRKRHWTLNLGLSFILGGALGNFIDRIRFTYVIDMFQLKFINFPIFNVADSFVTIGVVFVLIYAFVFDKE